MDLRFGSPLTKDAIVPHHPARSPSPIHSKKDDEINFATTKVRKSKHYRSPSPTTEPREGYSEAECESTRKENVEESTFHQTNKKSDGDVEQTSSENDEDEGKESVSKIGRDPAGEDETESEREQKEYGGKTVTRQVESVKERLQVVVDDTREQIYEEMNELRDLQEDQSREVEAVREEVETMKRKIEDLEAQGGRKRFKISFDLHWLGVSVLFGREGEAG
ncbi:hypothetical protein JCM5350_003781 [Sporobolomyces pararoseus]